MQGEWGFDQTCNTCCSFGVANLGFNGTQGNMLLFVVIFWKNLFQSLKLSQVSSSGPGSMSFDQAYTLRLKTSILIGSS